MSFLKKISPKEKYIYSLAILIIMGSFFVFDSILLSLTFSILVLLIVEQRYTQAVMQPRMIVKTEKSQKN